MLHRYMDKIRVIGQGQRGRSQAQRRCHACGALGVGKLC